MVDYRPKTPDSWLSEHYSESRMLLFPHIVQLRSLFCLGPNSIAPTRIGQPQSDRICQAHSHILRHIKIRRAGRHVPRAVCPAPPYLDSC